MLTGHALREVWPSAEASCLMQESALCGQLLQSHKKIVFHLSTVHSTEWLKAKSNPAFDPISHSHFFTHGRPCEACGVHIRNAKRHASQCAILLQLLLVRLDVRFRNTVETEDLVPLKQTLLPFKPVGSSASSSRQSTLHRFFASK